MKLCIAGKNDIAVNCLFYATSLGIFDELYVVSNRTDTGEDTWQKSLVKAANHLCIPVVDIENLYMLEDLIFISLEYDRIIRPEQFSTTRLFNVHFSLLPRYKGMYTSVWPLLNGEIKSGVTLHEIDHGIDTGNIIDQLDFVIPVQDTARDLYMKYLLYGEMIFKKNILDLIRGSFFSRKQESLNSSYFSMKSIDFNNIIINKHTTAFQLHNQIRAFSFKEYQLPVINGVKIIRSVITNDRSRQRAGEVLEDQCGHLLIATIDFDVRLEKYRD